MNLVFGNTFGYTHYKLINTNINKCTFLKSGVRFLRYEYVCFCVFNKRLLVLISCSHLIRGTCGYGSERLSQKPHCFHCDVMVRAKLQIYNSKHWPLAFTFNEINNQLHETNFSSQQNKHVKYNRVQA